MSTSSTAHTDLIAENTAATAMEVEFAKCDCCGLTEECTPAYIERIRERYQGRWICGLCAEAVKDETVRCERRISAEEALNRHLNFCSNFRPAEPPPDPTVHLIAAMRRMLRRRFTSMPNSPARRDGGEINRTALQRSESCLATISLVEVNRSVEMEQRCE